MNVGGVVSIAPVMDFERWRAELLLFAQKMGAGSDAEDVVQETFVRALERRPTSEPRAWLYRVAINLLRDRSRRDRRHADAVRDVARSAEAAEPSRAATRRDLGRRALDAAARLPESQRAALYLRLHQQMEYEEMATALDCSVPTARQHYYLAMRSLRDAIEMEGDEDA